MKRFLTLFLVSVMVFTLIACSSDDKLLGTEEFVTGTVEENVYENEYLGLGFKADPSWTFKTEAELSTLLGITADYMDEKYADLAKDAASYIDMMAADGTGSNSVNVNFAGFSHKQVMNADVSKVLEESFALIESSYYNMGATDVSYELTTVEIDGYEFDAMEVTAELSGTTLKQLVFGVKCYEHIASITITSATGVPLKDYLSSFYVLK